MNTNIIGVGFLSPVGEGLTGIKYHYQNGHSNQEIKKFDPTAYLGKTGLKFVGNSTIMYCNLAYQCVESSGIKHFFEQYSDRIGLYDGSELANIEEALLFDLTAKIEGPDSYYWTFLKKARKTGYLSLTKNPKIHVFLALPQIYKTV